MILSKQERLIALGVVAVIAILLANSFVLNPLLAYRSSLIDQSALTQVKVQQGSSLLANRTVVAKKWTGMVASGLTSERPSSERQMVNSVQEWAQQAGLKLDLIKPEPGGKEQQFQVVTLRATVSGNMGAIVRFLWRIQTASIPVRVTEMQMSARKEGVDDLSLQLNLSTLYLPPEVVKPGQPVATAELEVRP